MLWLKRCLTGCCVSRLVCEPALRNIPLCLVSMGVGVGGFGATARYRNIVLARHPVVSAKLSRDAAAVLVVR